MSPAPIKSLFQRELVNVPVKLLYSRQELLRKILANAAKRKTQAHLDATGARMDTYPQTFEFGKSVFENMHKKSNVLASPAVKSMQMGVQKLLGGLKTYGKRLTGDSTLKPLYAKRNLLRDMENNLRDATDLSRVERLAGLPKGTARGDSLDLHPLYSKLEQKGFSKTAPEWVDLVNANSHIYQRSRILDPKDGFLSNIYNQLVPADQAIAKELDAIRKTRLGTGAAATGTALGGILTGAYNNSKQSANLPAPTSRGTCKKVVMPEANKSEPDLDPEGVQMTNHDHAKQAFMGLGALAGMASAPNKEEEDLSIGRGALRGVGTGLGAAAGAGIGALGGTVGGAGLGAVLGALARAIPTGSPNRLSFSDAIGRGAATGGGLGYLAGIPAGAIYGGYKGNKATKALLDKTAPISDKKKTKKDDDDKDDKELKKAASALLAQLKQRA